MPTYAISDIHGCFNTLLELLSKVSFSPERDKLIIVGDIIDRGPRVKETLDYFIDLQERYGCCTFLVGNHEDMMIRGILCGEPWLGLWLSNGAYTTINALNIKIPGSYPLSNIYSIMDEKYLRFFLTMKSFHTDEKHFFVHASLCWDMWDVIADPYHMVWSRDHIVIPQLIDNKVLVHGHTPQPLEKIISQPPDSWIFNIDGGCVYKDIAGLGNLVAFRIDDHTFFIQKNVD